MSQAIKTKHWDRWARYFYDYFRLLQAQIETDGLWQLGSRYYIVCPRVSDATTARDGSLLKEWVHSNRPMTCPIEMNRIAPVGAIRLPDRTLSEVVALSGSPRNLTEIACELELLLPKDFPRFSISDFPSEIVIFVERTLSDFETNALVNAYSSLGSPVANLAIEVKPEIGTTKSAFRSEYFQTEMHLIPSSNYRGTDLSKDLIRLWQADEDFWRDHRREILAGKAQSKNDILPKAWNSKQSRCLVNATVFPPRKIMHYLSLYEKVALVAPISSHAQEILAHLGTSEDELVELVCLDRVQLILPQSLHRYPRKLIEHIAESSPENLLFSRRLAAATVADTRNRFPLLYPPIEVSARQEILRILLAATRDIKDENGAEILGRIVDQLCEIWSSFEYFINYRGAMGTANCGLGALVAKGYEAVSGRDLLLEFFSAGASVEWAATLGSTLFPVLSEDGQYSEERHSEILATWYTGIPLLGVKDFARQSDTVLEGVLSVANNVSPTEFARSFGSADINRLRRFVREIAEHTYSPTDATQIVTAFNAEVKKFEKRTEFLRTWDLSGLAVATAPLIASGGTKAFVPLAAWIGGIVARHIDKARPHNPIIGSLVDSMTGMLTGVPADAVLVSRMRRRIESDDA